MKKMLLTLTFLTSLMAQAYAAPVVLGVASLTDGKDRDVIHLRKCRLSPNRPVSEIQLRVKQFAAEIDHLKVEFQNGGKQVLHVKDHFYPGTHSRWMDLKGSKRCIKKIVVIGDADTFGWTPFKQAKVLFLGR